MASYGLIEILSNDGSETLVSGRQVNAWEPVISITSTGLKQGTAIDYVYLGNKKFLGVSTTPNAAEPTYAVGGEYTLPRIESLDILSLYIVEGEIEKPEQAPDPIEHKKLVNLSNSTWGIGSWTTSAGYLTLELSNRATVALRLDDTIYQYAFTKMYIGYEVASTSSASTTVREAEDKIVFVREGSIASQITASTEFYIYFGTVPKSDDTKKLQEWLEGYVSKGYGTTEGGVYHKLTKLFNSDITIKGNNKALRKLNLLPILNTPTISITNEILTITNEGSKTKNYDILIDGEVAETIGKVETYDLTNLNLENGSYSISIRGKAANYLNSKESNSVTYVVDKPVFESDDLTGTTWLLAPSPIVEANATYNVDVSYSRDGEELLTANTIKLEVQDWEDDGDPSEYIIRYGNDNIYMMGWNGLEPYIRTVTFTGGTDIKNPNLIAWLKKYGTFVKQELPVWNGTDLTGTIWKLNDTISLGEELSTYAVNFHLTQTSDKYVSLSVLYTLTKGVFYKASDDTSSFGLRVYYTSWTGTQYQEIMFDGGTDIKSTSLISWLDANGTLISHTMA